MPGTRKETAKRPYLRRSGVDWGDERASVPPSGDAEDKLLARSAGFGGDWRTLFLALLAPILIVVAGVGFVLQIQPEAEVKQPAAQPIPDPLEAFPQETRRSLLARELAAPARLKLSFAGKPDDLCRELADLGLPNSGWRRAPFLRGRWQCASDVVPLSTPSVDYGAATLFFLLRGASEERVDYLRLKLNVEDPRQMEHGRETVLAVMRALSERYSWAVPERFLEAVGAFDAVEMTDRGVRLSVAPEDPELTGDPAAIRRLNIILNFGEPDLIRPADGFERSAR